MKNYLNFENDIKNLEAELENLKDPYNESGLSEVDTNKISIIEKDLTITDFELKEKTEVAKDIVSVILKKINI